MSHSDRSPFFQWCAIVLWVGFAGVLFFVGARAQSDGSLDGRIDSQKGKLEQIQKEIKRHRAESKKLKREESSVLKHIANLDKEVALSRDLIKNLDIQEELLREHIDSLRANIVYEGSALAYQQKKLARRLRQMYKRGPNHNWEIILGSVDMQDAVERYKFSRLLADRDAHLVTSVADRKLGLESERAVLTEAMADVVSLKILRVDERKKLDTSKRQRVAMLKRVRGEKSKHTQAIDELKRSEEQLRNLINVLEQRRLAEKDKGLPTGDFAALKGRLMRPVEGPVTRRFGENRHPQFGTVTFNNGVDIKAPAGAPIRAVADAKVEFVDWISGYGNCIILNHGGGYYTLYAHAAEILVQPGQMVRVRDVIAEVGDSGSLSGYECHFEIRKSKQALNPADWFRE